MIKVFPIFRFNVGCDYHRVELPFKFSHGLNDNEAYKGFTEEKIFDYLAISDIVTYNRNFLLGIESINEARGRFGFKLIVDLDDWVKLPDYHPLYKNFKRGDGDLLLREVANADAVTVTTERLKDKLKSYNENIFVIPNALPYGYLQFKHKERAENEKFTFIYTGQTSHLEDVRLMSGAIKKVGMRNDVAFALAGYKDNKIWNMMEAVFKQARNYERIPSRSLYEYMDVYDIADCSLVPLCINEFNSCKSNLKLLEAAAKKIPCIVSWVPPYRDDEDAPVLWVKEPKDWIVHMNYLANNRYKAKELGQRLYEWAVKKYNLLDWNKKRFEMYSSICEKSGHIA